MNILNLVKYKTKSQIFNACCKLATHISAPKRLYNYYWTKYLYLQKLLTLLELRYLLLKCDKFLYLILFFQKNRFKIFTFVISFCFANFYNFSTSLLLYSKFHNRILNSPQFWKFQTHNSKAMAINKNVNIRVTNFFTGKKNIWLSTKNQA